MDKVNASIFYKNNIEHYLSPMNKKQTNLLIYKDDTYIHIYTMKNSSGRYVFYVLSGKGFGTDNPTFKLEVYEQLPISLFINEGEISLLNSEERIIMQLHKKNKLTTMNVMNPSKDNAWACSELFSFYTHTDLDEIGVSYGT